MSRRTTSAVLVATLLMAGAYWAGCGGGNDNDPSDTATFFGDVSSVTGSSASLDRKGTTLVARLLSFPSLAWAQSTCPAPSDGRLLFCVDEFCTTVDPDLCDFRVVAAIEGGGPATAVLRFIDDENEDGEFDASEGDSVVTQNLVFCTGDEVEIANAAINFTSGVTTATVTKVVDNCDGSTPTPTRTAGTPQPTNSPGATPTLPAATATAAAVATATAAAVRTATAVAGASPTPTGGAGAPTQTPNLPGLPGETPGTSPTPTTGYSYGVAMTGTPAIPFAFLASLGVIGLLIPRRRKRR